MAKHSSQGYVATFNSEDVGGKLNVPWPDWAPARIETSDLESTVKEYLLGLPEDADVAFNVIADPDDGGQQELITNYQANDAATSPGSTTQSMVVTAPATSTTESTPGNLTYTCWVSGWSMSTGVNNRAEWTFTLTVVAVPAYTAPTT